MQIANRRFRRYSTRIQGSMGDITRVAKEAIDAHRLIKIFNAEDHQTDRFETANELNRASNMKLARAKSLTNPVVQSIAAMALGGARQDGAGNQVGGLFGIVDGIEVAQNLFGGKSRRDWFGLGFLGRHDRKRKRKAEFYSLFEQLTHLRDERIHFDVVTRRRLQRPNLLDAVGFVAHGLCEFDAGDSLQNEV
jgi:hypothetical protein